MNKPVLPSSYNFISKISPFYLLAAVVIFALPFVLFIGRFNDAAGIEWAIAMMAACFFVWVSVILSFFAENWKRFIISALISYLILCGIFYLMCNWISGQPMSDFYEYRQLFAANNIFFGVGIMVARIIRSIAGFLATQ